MRISSTRLVSFTKDIVASIFVAETCEANHEQNI